MMRRRSLLIALVPVNEKPLGRPVALSELPLRCAASILVHLVRVGPFRHGKTVIAVRVCLLRELRFGRLLHGVYVAVLAARVVGIDGTLFTAFDPSTIERIVTVQRARAKQAVGIEALVTRIHVHTTRDAIVSQGGRALFRIIRRVLGLPARRLLQTGSTHFNQGIKVLVALLVIAVFSRVINARSI